MWAAQQHEPPGVVKLKSIERPHPGERNRKQIAFARLLLGMPARHYFLGQGQSHLAQVPVLDSSLSVRSPLLSGPKGGLFVSVHARLPLWVDSNTAAMGMSTTDKMAMNNRGKTYHLGGLKHPARLQRHRGTGNTNDTPI